MTPDDPDGPACGWCGAAAPGQIPEDGFAEVFCTDTSACQARRDGKLPDREPPAYLTAIRDMAAEAELELSSVTVAVAAFCESQDRSASARAHRAPGTPRDDP